MPVFGNPGVLPAEFKCSRCGVRWFVDEPTPWPAGAQVWTKEEIDDIDNQTRIYIPGEST
jgi:hypothetical protein